MDIKRLEGSLNQYIEELGIERSYGYMELGACLPSAEQAKLIGSNHVPLLRQTILWNVNDEPFELTTHYFVGDKFTITQDKITARSTQTTLSDHAREPLGQVRTFRADPSDLNGLFFLHSASDKKCKKKGRSH